MKTLLTILAFSLLASTAFGQLVITGIYDGPLTGGTPKGVELGADSDGVRVLEQRLDHGERLLVDVPAAR